MYKTYFTTQAEKYGFNAGSATFGIKPWNYSLSVHKPTIDAIKSAGGKLVRIDFNLKDSMNLTMLGEYEPIQKEYHRQLFDYLAKKDMIPVIVLCSDIQTQYVYRKALSDFTGDQTYLTDVNKFTKDTYRRKNKIPEVFWSMMNFHISEVIKLGAEVFNKNGKKWAGYSIVDIDNETAYVLDSDYTADRTIPYGTFPPGYNQMMEHRLYSAEGVNFYGSIFIPGGYENQHGIDVELSTGKGAWRRYARWENVHIYVTWATEDTKETFAVKMVNAYKAFAAKLDALNDPDRSGKPIAITEFNGIGIPKELRKEVMVYTAKQLLKISRVICAIGYTMVELGWNGTAFTPSKWAVLDFEKLKFGELGYVPYDYSAYPAAWSWSGYNWDSPSYGTTNKKQKECVHVVEKNIIIQFKKWIYNNSLYWGEGEITGPELGYGLYSFTTDTDINNIGKNIIFSMSINGKGLPNTPVAGQTSDIQIAKIGYSGEGSAQIEVFSSTETVTQQANLKDFTGILPSGKITFNLEYRPTFIKWDWFDESGNNIFTHTHTGFIPDPAIMQSKIKAAIYSKPGSEVLINKPTYVALSEFKFTP